VDDKTRRRKSQYTKPTIYIRKHLSNFNLALNLMLYYGAMKTNHYRTFDHTDHSDVERLFIIDGESVWAVVHCGVKLVPAQEADMLYNGYTESEAMKTDRAERLFTDYKTNFQLTHTSEQTADDLAALVDVVNASAPLGDDVSKLVMDWQLEAIAQEADSKDLQETYRSQLP
jgi:hypothetical protein